MGHEQSQAAWDALLQTLQGAGKGFLDPQKNLDECHRVQGYRHLAQMLSYGFDCYLDSDSLRPAFVPLAMPTRKILGDNVDSVYFFTQIRGDQRYRISGKRAAACYLGFTVYAGKPDGEWSERIALNINHTHMEFAPDGSFELVLAPQASAVEGEFALAEDAVCVISREYYFEPLRDPKALLCIANLSPVPAPQPETDAELARRLRAVNTFLQQSLQVVPMPMPVQANELYPPFAFQRNQPGWGTPDNVYALGMFRLADDEVLVIEGTSPDCAYWGVQTWNNYMQSFDYRHHQVSRNQRQLALEADGSWRIYLGPTDPGKGNWVGTAGHHEGMMFCRWLLAKEMPTKPATRVVKVRDV